MPAYVSVRRTLLKDRIKEQNGSRSQVNFSRNLDKHSHAITGPDGLAVKDSAVRSFVYRAKGYKETAQEADLNLFCICIEILPDVKPFP